MTDLAKKFTEQEMEIPTNIYVNCPLHGDNYPLVSVQNYCTNCSHWEGFFRQDYKGRQVPFMKEYSVKCGLPVSRQLTEVIE